jgi:hypothetical protein
MLPKKTPHAARLTSKPSLDVSHLGNVGEYPQQFENGVLIDPDIPLEISST